MEIDELIDRADPGIALLRQWAGQPSANNCVFRRPETDLARRTLLQLRVTTRSTLGAIVYETGGVSIAGGLIRLWGSGPERSLLQANRTAAMTAGRDLSDIVLVGDDAFGGLFAINGGGLGAVGLGEVFQLAADETTWSSLDVGHSDFVAWCMTGDLDILYGAGMQPGHLSGAEMPAFDRVLARYPFPWTPEGRAGSISAREVDADEHLRLRIEMSGFASE